MTTVHVWLDCRQPNVSASVLWRRLLGGKTSLKHSSSPSSMFVSTYSKACSLEWVSKSPYFYVNFVITPCLIFSFPERIWKDGLQHNVFEMWSEPANMNLVHDVTIARKRGVDHTLSHFIKNKPMLLSWFYMTANFCLIFTSWCRETSNTHCNVTGGLYLCSRIKVHFDFDFWRMIYSSKPHETNLKCSCVVGKKKNNFFSPTSCSQPIVMGSHSHIAYCSADLRYKVLLQPQKFFFGVSLGRMGFICL